MQYILTGTIWHENWEKRKYLLVKPTNVLKCNEDTGIAALHRQVLKMKVFVSDSFWKKWCQCTPSFNELRIIK